MRPWTELHASWSSARRAGRALACAGLLAAAMLATPGVAAGQENEGFFERIGLDRLRLTALGASYGRMQPSQMEATEVYSMHADYGEIAPRWRVVFTAAYWGTRYREDVVRTFADSIRSAIQEPVSDSSVKASPVTVSDIAVGADIRWVPRPETRRIRPYLAGNVSAHVINAEGALIAGTFVENALDNIATGIAAAAGVDIAPARWFSFGIQARFDLLSGSRYGSLRAVGTYHFESPAPGSGRL